jgi:hypothetical protein
VAIQLEALQRNSQPWNNHGIQTAYEFGLDVGGMEMSWYFGFTKGAHPPHLLLGLAGLAALAFCLCCLPVFVPAQRRAAQGGEQHACVPGRQAGMQDCLDQQSITYLLPPSPNHLCLLPAAQIYTTRTTSLVPFR